LRSPGETIHIPYKQISSSRKDEDDDDEEVREKLHRRNPLGARAVSDAKPSQTLSRRRRGRHRAPPPGAGHSMRDGPVTERARASRQRGPDRIPRGCRQPEARARPGRGNGTATAHPAAKPAQPRGLPKHADRRARSREPPGPHTGHRGRADRCSRGSRCRGCLRFLASSRATRIRHELAAQGHTKLALTPRAGTHWSSFRKRRRHTSAQRGPNISGASKEGCYDRIGLEVPQVTLPRTGKARSCPLPSRRPGFFTPS
jgi:hypothetical protein